MAPVLGYWAIRGLAQPARLMLAYAGEEFEDTKYEVGDAPDFNRDAWLNAKPSLGLDFPNLPYYIDGDLKLTQSNAIYRHIARKHKLYGDNDKEAAIIDMLADQIMDLRNDFIRLCYSPNYKNLRKGYDEQLPKKLKAFENYLAKKKFLLGDKISFPDFHLYEILDQNITMEPETLADFPILKTYMKNVEDLPAIKKYMASDKFMKSPINNKSAQFTG